MALSCLKSEVFVTLLSATASSVVNCLVYTAVMAQRRASLEYPLFDGLATIVKTAAVRFEIFCFACCQN
jgi:hypothetical protein